MSSCHLGVEGPRDKGRLLSWPNRVHPIFPELGGWWRAGSPQAGHIWPISSQVSCGRIHVALRACRDVTCASEHPLQPHCSRLDGRNTWLDGPRITSWKPQFAGFSSSEQKTHPSSSSDPRLSPLGPEHSCIVTGVDPWHPPAGHLCRGAHTDAPSMPLRLLLTFHVLSRSFSIVVGSLTRWHQSGVLTPHSHTLSPPVL